MIREIGPKRGDDVAQFIEHPVAQINSSEQRKTVLRTTRDEISFGCATIIFAKA